MNETETLCHQRDSKIDVLRTLCNLMIVVWHAWAVYRFCPKITGEFFFWKGICGLMTVTMPAFFFLSGYLLMCNLSSVTAGKKALRRFKRLFLPYLCWNVCFVMFLGALSFVNDSFLASFFGNWQFNSWKRVCSMIVGLVVAPADTPLWFLRALFLYSLLGIPLFLIVNRIRWGWVILFLTALLWAVVSEVLGIEPVVAYSYPSYSMSAFLLGAWFMHTGIHPFAFFDRLPFWLCGFVGIVGMALYTMQFKGFAWLKNISFLLELPVMFCVVNQFGGYFNGCKWFDIVNETSFFMYCGHWLFCPLSIALFYPLIVDVPGCLSLLILAFIGLGIPVMIIVRKMMMRFLPRTISLLMDGRL